MPSGLRRTLLCLAPALLVCLSPRLACAQAGESDLQVYGYLQASFYYQMVDEGPNTNTFTVQQLDIMLQKNLSRRWSSFVDLLLTNNYSSFRNEGTIDLEQAWVRYRRSYLLSVKMGLLIPRFNYLNEIKNKMPLLPYIIRPIVYETSFQEDVYIDEFVPQRAYVQVYGYVPVDDYKFDYAGYVGNSPNINAAPPEQTGLDTTTTFLIGGRVGVRHPSFEVGFSATYDKPDFATGFDDQVTPPLQFRGISRVRLGGDVFAETRNFSLRGEFIRVRYGDFHPVINVDKDFYYATLGYRFRGSLFVYLSYWVLEQNLALRSAPDDILTAEWRMKIPNGGVAYQVTDRITFKGGYARGIQTWSVAGLPETTFNFYAVAVSVMF